MAKQKLISVETALALIAQNTKPLGHEIISITGAAGRILGEDIKARLTLPPADASAMDGYAVKLLDEYDIGTKLDIIGISPAGAPFNGEVKPYQAVRIYTGGAIPKGANHVIMQENVKVSDGHIILTEPISKASHIRKAGIDFNKNDILLKSGTRLDGYALGLCAAANIAKLKLCKKPKIVLLANGDELVEPGTNPQNGQIISSNPYGLAPLLKAWGAEITNAGISKDEPEAIKAQILAHKDADILVPIGGASVGDRDYMRTVFAALGLEKIFEKVAVKPGKPVWFGRMSGEISGPMVLGLPGNPASALVTAHIFLKPLIENLTAMRNTPENLPEKLPAITRVDLPASTWRTEYIRAKAEIAPDGKLYLTPFPRQDSSLLTPFIEANCFLVRNPNRPAAKAGDIVEILPIKQIKPGLADVGCTVNIKSSPCC